MRKVVLRGKGNIYELTGCDGDGDRVKTVTKECEETGHEFSLALYNFFADEFSHNIAYKTNIAYKLMNYNKNLSSATFDDAHYLSYRTDY